MRSLAARIAVAFDGDDDEPGLGGDVVDQVVRAAEDDDRDSFVAAELLHHQVLTLLDIRLRNCAQLAGSVQWLCESQTFVCVQSVNSDLPFHKQAGRQHQR